MIEWIKAIFNLAKANNEFMKLFDERLAKIEKSLNIEETPSDDGDGSSVEKTKEDE